MSDQIPLHVVAVAAIVRKGNKYLLAKRSSTDDQSPGEWSMPGGKVEKASGPARLEETLQKEVMEEVGIRIKDKVRLVCNDSFIRSSGDQVIMLTFLCEWLSGEAKPLEDQEEVRWLSLEEIMSMEDLPDYTKRRFLAMKSNEK